MNNMNSYLPNSMDPNDPVWKEMIRIQATQDLNQNLGYQTGNAQPFAAGNDNIVPQPTTGTGLALAAPGIVTPPVPIVNNPGTLENQATYAGLPTGNENPLLQLPAFSGNNLFPQNMDPALFENMHFNLYQNPGFPTAGNSVPSVEGQPLPVPGQTIITPPDQYTALDQLNAQQVQLGIQQLLPASGQANIIPVESASVPAQQDAQKAQLAAQQAQPDILQFAPVFEQANDIPVEPVSVPAQQDAQQVQLAAQQVQAVAQQAQPDAQQVQPNTQQTKHNPYAHVPELDSPYAQQALPGFVSQTPITNGLAPSFDNTLPNPGAQGSFLYHVQTPQNQPAFGVSPLDQTPSGTWPAPNQPAFSGYQPQAQLAHVGPEAQTRPQVIANPNSDPGPSSNNPTGVQPQGQPQPAINRAQTEPQAPVVFSQGGRADNTVMVAQYTELEEKFPGGFTYRGNPSPDSDDTDNEFDEAGYFIDSALLQSPESIKALEEMNLRPTRMVPGDKLPKDNMLAFYAHPAAYNSWTTAPNSIIPDAAPVARRARKGPFRK